MISLTLTKYTGGFRSGAQMVSMLDMLNSCQVEVNETKSYPTASCFPRFGVTVIPEQDLSTTATWQRLAISPFPWSTLFHLPHFVHPETTAGSLGDQSKCKNRLNTREAPVHVVRVLTYFIRWRSLQSFSEETITTDTRADQHRTAWGMRTACIHEVSVNIVVVSTYFIRRSLQSFSEETITTDTCADQHHTAWDLRTACIHAVL